MSFITGCFHIGVYLLICQEFDENIVTTGVRTGSSETDCQTDFFCVLDFFSLLMLFMKGLCLLTYEFVFVKTEGKNKENIPHFAAFSLCTASVLPSGESQKSKVKLSTVSVMGPAGEKLIGRC